MQAVIYVAGGCFWGTEKLMASVPGVLDASSGYANGNIENPTYQQVCAGGTAFRETVKVVYDPQQVSLESILYIYFDSIDTTVRNRQGHDIGEQYQTGVYYTDDASAKIVQRVAASVRARGKAFYTEIKPLENFYPAEAYHQDYLDKNPEGYCHLPFEAFARASRLSVDASAYRRPSQDELRARLSPEVYHITQEEGTEAPFQNAYWNHFEKGLYVDVVTGEPLFSSEDKYQSSCGWPAFAAPVDENVLVETEDCSHGMVRTELKSRVGATHLGHVFDRDTESPTGKRYCIDSASLRFIPYERLEAEGYAACRSWFADKEV